MFYITQYQTELLLDRNFFGSHTTSTTVFTEDHRFLAKAYRLKFLRPFRARPVLTLTQLYHQFTRIIYEWLLNDDILPFTSVLSPHQAYSHLQAAVCIYSRPIEEWHGFFDVQVGDITYVLEYDCGVCT